MIGLFFSGIAAGFAYFPAMRLLRRFTKVTIDGVD